MYKEKIEKILAELSSGLFEREECLKLVLLSMFAGKSIFLYGPPGTAKSMIARRASLAFKSSKENSRIPSDESLGNSRIPNNKNKDFFAYLMNRFSTPEEIFGPIDISELKKNNLTRKTEGYLPTAHFAFLDEIWKSSPAILNTLLTIINERIYRDGNTDKKVPLKGIVCASNEFPPANQGLEALYDRMILRYFVKPLEERENFEKLLFESSDDFSNVSDVFLPEIIEKIQNDSKKIKFSKKAKELICAIKNTIDISSKTLVKAPSDESEKQEQIKALYVSDRRWKQCAELLQTAALLSDREEVLASDVAILAHTLWESEEQVEFVRNIIKENIMMMSEENSEAKAILADFKKLEELCKKNAKSEYANIATELQKRALNEINALKEVYKKECLKANPFLSQNDKELAFSNITESIKELQNIVLGAKELGEKIASGDTKEIAKKKNTDEFDKKLDKLLVNTKLISRDVIFKDAVDGAFSLISQSFGGQVKKDNSNKAKKIDTKQKIKECAKDILLGKKDFNSLDDFILGKADNTANFLSALGSLSGDHRGYGGYILEEEAKKTEQELKPIKDLIKEYKAKLKELK